MERTWVIVLFCNTSVLFWGIYTVLECLSGIEYLYPITFPRRKTFYSLYFISFITNPNALFFSSPANAWMLQVHSISSWAFFLLRFVHISVKVFSQILRSRQSFQKSATFLYLLRPSSFRHVPTFQTFLHFKARVRLLDFFHWSTVLAGCFHF